MVLTSLWISCFLAAGALELAVPFTDNMILQRGQEVPVWGFDQPGSEITVEFAGEVKKAVADEDGDWMVRLGSLEASLEERIFRVKNGKGESISLKGVLVGEVWFSSGQSNMVWTAGKSMCRELAKTISSSEKKNGISSAAVSGASDP